MVILGFGSDHIPPMQARHCIMLTLLPLHTCTIQSRAQSIGDGHSGLWVRPSTSHASSTLYYAYVISLAYMYSYKESPKYRRWSFLALDPTIYLTCKLDFVLCLRYFPFIHVLYKVEPKV